MQVCSDVLQSTVLVLTIFRICQIIVWSRITGLFSEYDQIPCKVAGIVPRGCEAGHLDLDRLVSKSDRHSMSLAACYALIASTEALSDANWKPRTEEQQHRTGILLCILRVHCARCVLLN